ncbi:Flp family type IVb pilin [Rugamonas aquatica]|uniref:Flp family type IVb pilin n=1 Tax=Rugamonas aquatica TaxID=2743357 RepID=A0A6A7N4U2_9BURK|nr:Flp family type IVb pilin [Rugamonas aquatica]MQA39906.1 Flp family type IVb pilin [Rugamonas aquatica]MQA39907.1 Flp family type IVb pilin [Rugamonas aquatica]
MNSIKNFINDESGVTAIEYAMIAALVAVVGLTAVKTLGTQIQALFAKVVTATA